MSTNYYYGAFVTLRIAKRDGGTFRVPLDGRGNQQQDIDAALTRVRRAFSTTAFVADSLGRDCVLRVSPCPTAMLARWAEVLLTNGADDDAVSAACKLARRKYGANTEDTPRGRLLAGLIGASKSVAIQLNPGESCPVPCGLKPNAAEQNLIRRQLRGISVVWRKSYMTLTRPAEGQGVQSA